MGNIKSFTVGFNVGNIKPFTVGFNVGNIILVI